MTRKAYFVLFFALVAAMAIALPLQAITLGGSGLKLNVTGAVTVKAGPHTPLTLTVTVTNNSSASIRCDSLQAVVIDPWTGTRIVGPNSVTVNTLLNGETTGQNCDDYGNCYTYTVPGSGGSTPVTVSLTIPTTFLGTYTSTVNKTLAVMIYALDDHATVVGVTGWAFFATQ